MKHVVSLRLTHPGCGRGISPFRASPFLYCLPSTSARRGTDTVNAGLSRPGSGGVGSDRGIKKSVDDLGGVSHSEGDEKEGSRKKVRESFKKTGRVMLGKWIRTYASYVYIYIYIYIYCEP